MKQHLPRLFIAMAGLVVLGSLFQSTIHEFFSRQNDFLPFYVAAQLAGRGEIYDPAPYLEFESQNFELQTGLHYVRLPFYAFLLKPLSWLGYREAYAVWSVLRLAALAGFLVLWRCPSRAVSLTYACWSLPLLASMLGGQDIVFPLLGIALSVHLYESGRPLASGLAMTLFAIKFHLFLLVPLVLLHPTRRRALAGFGAGVVVLMILNVGVSGWDWPWKFLAAATGEVQNPSIGTMPNLRGLFNAAPHAGWWQLSSTVAGLILGGFAIWKAEFRVGLALAVVAGLLFGNHAYVSDCTLLLPAALTLAHDTKTDWIRLATIMVLAPPLALALLAGPPASYGMQITLAAYFTAAAWFALRQQRQVSPDPA